MSGSRRLRGGGQSVEFSEFVKLAFTGGLVVAACGATYWGGQVSSGIKQLQTMGRDHEERLRAGDL
jgi:hypothetical protein